MKHLLEVARFIQTQIVPPPPRQTPRLCRKPRTSSRPLPSATRNRLSLSRRVSTPLIIEGPLQQEGSSKPSKVESHLYYGIIKQKVFSVQSKTEFERSRKISTFKKLVEQGGTSSKILKKQLARTKKQGLKIEISSARGQESRKREQPGGKKLAECKVERKPAEPQLPKRRMKSKRRKNLEYYDCLMGKNVLSKEESSQLIEEMEKKLDSLYSLGVFEKCADQRSNFELDMMLEHGIRTQPWHKTMMPIQLKGEEAGDLLAFRYEHVFRRNYLFLSQGCCTLVSRLVSFRIEVSQPRRFLSNTQFELKVCILQQTYILRFTHLSSELMIFYQNHMNALAGEENRNVVVAAKILRLALNKKGSAKITQAETLGDTALRSLQNSVVHIFHNFVRSEFKLSGKTYSISFLNYEKREQLQRRQWQIKQSLLFPYLQSPLTLEQTGFTVIFLLKIGVNYSFVLFKGDIASVKLQIFGAGAFSKLASCAMPLEKLKFLLPFKKAIQHGGRRTQFILHVVQKLTLRIHLDEAQLTIREKPQETHQPIRFRKPNFKETREEESEPKERLLETISERQRKWKPSDSSHRKFRRVSIQKRVVRLYLSNQVLQVYMSQSIARAVCNPRNKLLDRLDKFSSAKFMQFLVFKPNMRLAKYLMPKLRGSPEKTYQLESCEPPHQSLLRNVFRLVNHQKLVLEETRFIKQVSLNFVRGGAKYWARVAEYCPIMFGYEALNFKILRIELGVVARPNLLYNIICDEKDLEEMSPSQKSLDQLALRLVPTLSVQQVGPLKKLVLTSPISRTPFTNLSHFSSRFAHGRILTQHFRNESFISSCNKYDRSLGCFVLLHLSQMRSGDGFILRLYIPKFQYVGYVTLDSVKDAAATLDSVEVEEECMKVLGKSCPLFFGNPIFYDWKGAPRMLAYRVLCSWPSFIRKHYEETKNTTFSYVALDMQLLPKDLYQLKAGEAIQLFRKLTGTNEPTRLSVRLLQRMAHVFCQGLVGSDSRSLRGFFQQQRVRQVSRVFAKGMLLQLQIDEQGYLMRLDNMKERTRVVRVSERQLRRQIAFYDVIKERGQGVMLYRKILSTLRHKLIVEKTDH